MLRPGITSDLCLAVPCPLPSVDPARPGWLGEATRVGPASESPMDQLSDPILAHCPVLRNQDGPIRRGKMGRPASESPMDQLRDRKRGWPCSDCPAPEKPKMGQSEEHVRTASLLAELPIRMARILGLASVCEQQAE